MKNIILTLFVLSSIFFSCTNKKEYQEKLKSTINLVEECTYSNGAIAEDCINVWNKAIFDKEYDGEYCSDFNKAIYKNKEKLSKTELYKEIIDKNKKLDAMVKDLKDYPKDMKEAYDEIISIYVDTHQLCELAENPSGSLQTYSEETRKLISTISKRINEFKIKYINE